MRKLYFFLLLLFFAGQNIQAQTPTVNVVFHVVYKIAAQNIPDSCLQQQLDVLNEDFNAANSDLWKVPAAWTPIIGNMNVNFALATVDPNGNPTTGIERQQTAVTSFTTNNNVCYNATGGMDAWPDTSYLNIWICNLSGGLAGYAQFPGGPAATDGVVLHYQFTGRGSYCISPFNLGRAGTHEVAHWFGLKNFAPQSSCSTDGDNIPDTPTYINNTIYGGFNPFSVVTDACNPSAPGIMWMNFMDFTDDSSMYFFTQNQTDTMTWVLNNMRLGTTVTGQNDLVGADQSFKIFPSPSADGIFTLTRSDEVPVMISVYTNTGQIVSTVNATGKTFTLDLSELPDGMYAVAFVHDGRQQVKKIVIAQ